MKTPAAEHQPSNHSNFGHEFDPPLTRKGKVGFGLLVALVLGGCVSVTAYKDHYENGVAKKEAALETQVPDHVVKDGFEASDINYFGINGRIRLDLRVDDNCELTNVDADYDGRFNDVEDVKNYKISRSLSSSAASGVVGNVVVLTFQNEEDLRQNVLRGQSCAALLGN